MKIKSGTKVRVTHKRKGTFTGYAAEDFDTETTEFYPIKAAHFAERKVIPLVNCKIKCCENYKPVSEEIEDIPSADHYADCLN